MERCELSSKVPNTRLKLGILISILGAILQFILELNRQMDEIVNSGALLTCITYGTIGNDCQEKYAVSSNPIGWFIFYVGLCIIFGHFSGKIALDKGRDYNNYFWLGFLLGLIGLLIVSLMSDQSTQKVKVVSEDLLEDQKKCKFCAEHIKKDAIFCKHCKSNLN